MASASGMASITKSFTSFHLAAAAGAEASRHNMTSARLKGTPAASKLESRRVKFSSIRAETFWAWPKESLNELDSSFGFSEVDSLGAAFGALLAGALPPL